MQTPISKEAAERIREGWIEAHNGAHNAARTMILDNGAKWEQITISPEDAELLESRRFTGEELARLYQVPPPIIGDLAHGTFTNSETLIRFFAQSTLSACCRKIEAEIQKTLFSEASRAAYCFELDLSGLLRGDPETRWKNYDVAIRNHILTPNEVREAEGWNNRPGGDEFPQVSAQVRA